MSEQLVRVEGRALVLSEVPPIYGDCIDNAGYQNCDCCMESAIIDIWAGKSEADWRRFYEVLGECGLVVCENCLPGLDAGGPP